LRTELADTTLTELLAHLRSVHKRYSQMSFW